MLAGAGLMVRKCLQIHEDGLIREYLALAGFKTKSVVAGRSWVGRSEHRTKLWEKVEKNSVFGATRASWLWLQFE